MTTQTSSEYLGEPLRDRGTALTTDQRERLGLTGRLPPCVETLERQVVRALAAIRAKSSALEKYEYLSALQAENETLFYRLVVDHLAEMLPLIYTPVVGAACLQWSRLYVRPRGLYLTPEHTGRMVEILRQWPSRNVRVVVATDGQRILGLGDLGANGMGIPIGKLALYSACGGLMPAAGLPVMLDAGTDNPSVRDDPLYIGRREPRLNGQAYDRFIDAFVNSVAEAFPDALLQFEDFGNVNAFRLLERYRDQLCCFNDDIQGTGAMGLAGILASERISGRSLGQERILFVGAGQANLGIGASVVDALARLGLDSAQARAQCLFFDSRGPVSIDRVDLSEHKRRFACPAGVPADLEAAIRWFRPTVLIGACGQGGRFGAAVLRAALCGCKRPIIFALSNPTEKSECTAEQAYRFTDGQALFASGSPFEAPALAATAWQPAQANNATVFPGLGMGIAVAGAKRVTNAMCWAAAEALAAEVSAAELARNSIFPAQARLREVAQAIAIAVARAAFDEGIATRPAPRDLPTAVAESIFVPRYA
jgi:malate dehydrogenase (oxaloacetate-decarboxylating)(NADP+)